MLSPKIVHQIELLLEEGFSQRSVARRLGVSRQAVGQVALGGREYVYRGPDEQDGPQYLRCPGCGMRVQLPCVYCRTVAYVSRRQPGGACPPRQQAA